MKNSLLLFVGAAALSLASCSQEKTTDTTTTTTDASATAATPDTAAYRTRSQRIADKFASDMKITDEATKAKIRTAYYNRSKRYSEMTSKYKSDTTGMAAAMRQYNTDTDTEFQNVLTDPTQYQSYQSSRSTYDESNYLDNTDTGAASTTTTDATPTDDASPTAASTDNTTGMSGGAVKDSKTKLEDGSKIKIKDDGTVKTKGNPVASDAALQDSKTKLQDGSKIKVKGDGTVKLKDADGNKSKL
ncbi:hypothetical protein GO988_21765 [Hymenobacter sp. HMF4947]|uniref:Lipoprotein n=1 Tax=Hymenobacter ginkgonis TaxID=2682976 RepID=A0A7K1TKT8_9BACT|nr:hypothetical protein [Hymenobacter ginkgonis]MVN78966.1 hypothetical protein [Hymenobacter ginkgonis]